MLSYASHGEDLSLLLPSMVKLLAHHDLCVKKLAGEVLIQHSRDHAEMVMLAINTLSLDTQESSPMVRGVVNLHSSTCSTTHLWMCIIYQVRQSVKNVPV